MAEFKEALVGLGVTVSDNSPKARRRDWLYALADKPTRRVSGEKLGLLYSVFVNSFMNKLARNSKLGQNLKNQVDVYKKANGTDSAITVIIVYTEAEQKKVEKTINELGLQGDPSVITIDARCDNKPSGSNA